MFLDTANRNFHIESYLDPLNNTEYARQLLLSDTWIVTEETHYSPSKKTKEYDLEPIFIGIDTICKLTLKMAFLHESFIHVNENIIHCKHSTFKSIIRHIIRVCDTLRELGKTNLSGINNYTIQLFYKTIIKSSGDLLAFGTVRETLKFLIRLYNIHEAFELPDAPRCEISIERFTEDVGDIVNEHMDYNEWIEGGSLGGMPVEIGMLLLDEAISRVQDKDELALILAFYSTFEDLEKDKLVQSPATTIENFFKSDWKLDEVGPYIEVIRRSNIRYKGKLNIYRKRHAKSDTFLFAKRVFCYFEKNGGNFDNLYFPKSLSELKNRIRNMLIACRVTVQILSGARKSEINSLRIDSFNEVDSDAASFSSNIRKTNHNIETTRLISAIAIDIVNVAIQLDSPSSGYPKSNSLWQINIPWNKGKVITVMGSSGTDSVIAWCRNVLSSNFSDIEIGEIPLNDHAFRHLFAEFSLRRFDGNVTEALRQHFRHAYASYMTFEYTKNKIKLNSPALGKEYIRELIGQAYKGDIELFGPVGRFILAMIKDIPILTSDNIEAIADKFDLIEPHEYGYCMIRKDQNSQAKCHDKKTSMPIYDNAKFATCGGCPGQLRLANHRDSIIRIGMREKEVMSAREAMGLTTLANASKRILSLCEAAISDFDKKPEIN